jgi:hypothetical protein
MAVIVAGPKTDRNKASLLITPENNPLLGFNFVVIFIMATSLLLIKVRPCIGLYGS